MSIFNYPIEVKNLRCCLGGQEIVSGVSFKINKGKLYSIIGPNGSGKTTLLRTIASQLEPENGEVLIDNISTPSIR